ncbi:DsbC/DsbD-like thiol-disulfide interchange protein [Litoreibacter ponti]|uniref:DsbC/DsbD-like thiol-disulfide interchange protein n=1 Tax=Litoreibacter ponti TaxID=1510457 RepID=A0A2T6BFT6_9RHOB|nr:protein-disulfide reductase DsbD domain-containing protein [Litoreibacter ponti]PTX54911.1 DsbC/DsbD-like thiol-disulfide interchange protein [Litoreibacter ponti]
MTPATAAAQVLADNASDVVEVSLLPGWREADGTHMAALRITLAPGWKTYWRAPGDGGVPTRFDFSKSYNLDEARVLWPTPEVFRQNGLRSIGYRDEVVVPLQLDAQADADDITLHAYMDFGVCADVCLPVNMVLDHTFAAGEVSNVDLIEAAFADRPAPAETSGLHSIECDISYGPEQAEIAISMELPQLPGRNEALVIEPSDPSLWVSEPKVTRDGDRLSAKAYIAKPTGEPFTLDLSRTRMTVLTTQMGVDIPGC